MKKNNLKKLSLKKEIVAKLDSKNMNQIAGGQTGNNHCASNPCSDFRACNPDTADLLSLVLC